jgi:release factor glutamine methyltransferase
MSPTIREMLDRARQLAPVSSSARLDVELLLSHALEKPRSYLYAWPDRQLSPDRAELMEALLQRRLAGEPVAYITGVREFWSLALSVTPAVLIPRPETELLVELALSRLAAPGHLGAIADLGTGSGAIALALASELPGRRIVAVDCSEEALAVARRNGERLDLPIEWRSGNWCQGLPAQERFRMIVSNPPYIGEKDPHLLQGDLRSEPRGALVAADEGFADLGLIATGARGCLLEGGWLLMEHGYAQAAGVRRLLQDLGYDAIESCRDLAGHERVTLGRFHA